MGKKKEMTEVVKRAREIENQEVKQRCGCCEVYSIKSEHFFSMKDGY